MAGSKYNSPFYKYCLTKMQDIIYCEYAIRALRHESEEAKQFHEYLKTKRIENTQFLSQSIPKQENPAIPHDPVEDLSLVDYVFDFIQYGVHHLDEPSLNSYSMELDQWFRLCNQLKKEFFENIPDYDFMDSKIFESFRFADLSRAYKVEDMIKA